MPLCRRWVVTTHWTFWFNSAKLKCVCVRRVRTLLHYSEAQGHVLLNLRREWRVQTGSVHEARAGTGHEVELVLRGQQTTATQALRQPCILDRFSRTSSFPRCLVRVNEIWYAQIRIWRAVVRRRCGGQVRKQTLHWRASLIGESRVVRGRGGRAGAHTDKSSFL